MSVCVAPQVQAVVASLRTAPALDKRRAQLEDASVAKDIADVVSLFVSPCQPASVGGVVRETGEPQAAAAAGVVPRFR
jgi:hypothetical protein